MKRSMLAVMLLSTLAISVVSCKKGPKDADLQKAATEQLAANPALAGMMVAVKEGVATISGECADEAACSACVAAVKGIPGVKSVVNNCTMKEVVPEVESPVEEVAMDAVTQAVTDALKDNPGVTATVTDGVVSLAGKVSKTKLRGLMQTLQSLAGVKKVDASGLTVE